jgi:hypothetical protein
LSHHESEPSVVAFSTGDLRCEGEELLVNKSLGKKVTQQRRSALDQNPLRATYATYFSEDSLRRYRAAAAMYGAYLNRGAHPLASKSPSTCCGRQDQSMHSLGLEDGQAQINSATPGYDHIQWGFALAQSLSEAPIVSAEFRTNGFGRPNMVAVGTQCARTHDYDVCYCTQ